MIYLYIGVGAYLLVSSVLVFRWALKKIRLRKALRDKKQTEDRDPFFDKFYPHF
tara:strand:+ start:86 stop:247 length:162 start_codon:yes stop_codon:yes gene_type:complete